MTRFGIHSTTQLEGAAGDAQEAALARTQRIRHRALGIAFTVVALAYAVRLGDLQILESEAHRARQVAQSAEWEMLPAVRGRILDRRGRVLAAPDTRYQAFLAVDELRVDRAEAIEAVASVVPVGAGRRSAVAEAAGGWSLVASDVSDEERVRLQRTIGRGIYFESRSAREYPRSMGRRLIGAVGSDGRGGTGLEADLDSWLVGEPGRAEVRLDGHRNAYRPPGGQVVEAVPGHDVVLTLDAELQRIAENELARAIAKTGAGGGDIVLLDPRTGEVLALASERTDGAVDQISGLGDPYEPGSTLKPFLLASLLSEGVVDLDEIVDVEDGRLRIGSRVISDVHGYDTLSVRGIISRSSNVGAAKLSARLTPAVQHRYLRDFGFGMRTQLGYLSESPGRLSRPESWTSLSPASHAIGYEISATSLQLALAYGAIANGGVLMRPRLVREIRDPFGRLVQRFDPSPVRRVISEEVAAAVRGVLEEVVREGTGTLASMARFAVAGKTGTARLAVNGRYAPDATAPPSSVSRRRTTRGSSSSRDSKTRREACTTGARSRRPPARRPSGRRSRPTACRWIHGWSSPTPVPGRGPADRRTAHRTEPSSSPPAGRARPAGPTAPTRAAEASSRCRTWRDCPPGRPPRVCTRSASAWNGAARAGSRDRAPRPGARCPGARPSC